MITPRQPRKEAWKVYPYQEAFIKLLRKRQPVKIIIDWPRMCGKRQLIQLLQKLKEEVNMSNDKKPEAKVAGKGPELPKKVSAEMPKVPVKTVGEPKPKKEKAAKVETVGANYTLLKAFDAAGSEKMPLQCRQILEILGKAEGQTLEKKDFLAEMAKIIQTRQPIERILAFYQPRLLSGKYFKMDKITAVAKPAEAPAA